MKYKTQLERIAELKVRKYKDTIGDELAQQIIDLCHPQCKWKMDSNPDYEVWESTCGNAFVLNEGTPEENEMNYCPYCGGKLIQEFA